MDWTAQAVARNYLTGWFTVDVLSTVPWEALVGVRYAIIRLLVLRYLTSDVVFVCSRAGVSVSQRVVECEVVVCAQSAKVLALGVFYSPA